MKKFFLFAIGCLSISTILMSCKKEVDTKLSSTAKNSQFINGNIFFPRNTVTIKDGYLSFPSYESMDSFLLQLNTTEDIAINIWEIANNFESQRRIFSETVIAEDSINSLFESGDLTGEQIFSNQLNRAIDLGVIKYKVDDRDNTEYWALATRFDYLKGVLNKDGLVEIDNKLHKYYPNGTKKVAKASGFNPLSFDAITSPNELIDIYTVPPETVVYETDAVRNVGPSSECRSEYPYAANDSYTKSNDWKYPENRKRVKLELVWYSAKSFSQQDCQRFGGIEVKFYLRSYAQKKNFWGKWVTGNWTALLTYTVNSREYQYSTNMSCLSSAIFRTNDLPILNAATLPGQTWSNYTNNGTLPINPHVSGWYVFNFATTTERFKCPAFLKNYSITANYAGKTDWGLQ